jgi:hypothetical protein
MPDSEAPFRVIVAGDRRMLPEHYPFVREWLDRLLAVKLPHVVILSGAARGVDALGEQYARERKLPCERYPARWQDHGRRAGPMRNHDMCDHAQALVAFDGGGPGTADVQRQAALAGLIVRVVDVRHLVGAAVT